VLRWGWIVKEWTMEALIWIVIVIVGTLMGRAVNRFFFG
jgi:hypothetical protein